MHARCLFFLPAFFVFQNTIYTIYAFGRIICLPIQQKKLRYLLFPFHVFFLSFFLQISLPPDCQNRSRYNFTCPIYTPIAKETVFDSSRFPVLSFVQIASMIISLDCLIGMGFSFPAFEKLAVFIKLVIYMIFQRDK